MSDPIYICKPMFDGLNSSFSLFGAAVGIGIMLFVWFGHIPIGWLMWGVSWVIWRIVEFKQKLSKR